MNTRAEADKMRTYAQLLLLPLRQAAMVQWGILADGTPELSSWVKYAEREHREMLINEWLYYKYDIETLKEFYVNYLENLV